MKCECGNEFYPKSWGNGSVMCPSCVTNRRRFELKQKCVEYLGGKCIKCGYDKCIAALEFDHRNPKEKEFHFSGKHCLSWERLKKELDKCDLLCANCHRERHWNETQRNRKYKEEYKSARHYELVEAVCEQCSGKYFRSFAETDRKYCSLSCASKSHHRIEWPNIEVLVQRLQNGSFMAVSGELGVSDNAIRKHLVKFGVNPKKVRSIKDNGYKRRP